MHLCLTWDCKGGSNTKWWKSTLLRYQHIGQDRLLLFNFGEKSIEECIVPKQTCLVHELSTSLVNQRNVFNLPSFEVKRARPPSPHWWIYVKPLFKDFFIDFKLAKSVDRKAYLPDFFLLGLLIFLIKVFNKIWVANVRLAPLGL